MKSRARRTSTDWYGLAGIVLLGLFLRIALVALPWNELTTPWSGGSDTLAYVTLAKNLLEGRGLSYGGYPSAFRPPGYPLFLAGMMYSFRNHYVVAVRWLQLAMGLVTVCLCAAASARLFGKEAGKAALVVSLFFPTLALTTTEILTECVATLLSALFLFLLIDHVIEPSWSMASGLAITTGVATMFRYNMLPLTVVALFAVWAPKTFPTRWAQAAWVALLTALMVTPWISRNEIVFGGRVLFSTQAGLNAAVAMLTPQGRTQPGDTEKVKQAFGWFPPQDLETNASTRNTLPPEPELNHQGWNVARQLWKDAGWRWIPLLLSKWTCFWLSTDQVFSTGSFRLSQKLFRAAGVLVYWLILALAVSGWFRLRMRLPRAASLLLFYSLLFTFLHSLFVMNTRIRMPLMDPMLAMLAGGGWLRLKARWSGRLSRKEKSADSHPSALGQRHKLILCSAGSEAKVAVCVDTRSSPLNGHRVQGRTFKPRRLTASWLPCFFSSLPIAHANASHAPPSTFNFQLCRFICTPSARSASVTSTHLAKKARGTPPFLSRGTGIGFGE